MYTHWRFLTILKNPDRFQDVLLITVDKKNIMGFLYISDIEKNSDLI